MRRSLEREHNLLLEAALHKEATFATLTYRDENLTFLANGLPTLVKQDATNFVKRFREHLARAIPGAKARIAYAGEYGPNGQRPHFHVAIFGVPANLARPLLEKAWTLGFVDAIDFTREKATYMAKDIIKGLTRPNTPILDGRQPEFFQGPHRPGLGMGAIKQTADAILDLERRTGRRYIDAPAVLNHGKRSRPINAYRRRRMREFMGRAPNTPHGAKPQYDDEMKAAIAAAQQDATQPGGRHQFGKFLRQRMAEAAKPKIIAIRSRLLLRKRFHR